MELHEISSSKMCVQISPLGAEVQKIKLFRSPHNWIWAGTEPWKRSAPILFPIVGKLKKDRYFYAGCEFNLGQHGFARDSQFTVTKKSTTSLIFRLQASEASLKTYPFRFTLDVQYTIKETTLHVAYFIKNQDHSTMYFNIGWHPAFVLPGQSSLGSLILRASSPFRRYHLLADGLITSQTFTTQEKNDTLVLTPEVFTNDALIFQNCGINHVELKDALGNSVFLELGTAPHLGVWSKDVSKFVCTEPWWGYADTWDVNGQIQDKPGIQSLAAGKTWSSEMSVTLT